MSVKIYDKKQNKWVIFPGTVGAPGKDAYTIAKENGYQGTEDEFNSALGRVGDTDIAGQLNPVKADLERLQNFVYSKHLTINTSITGSNFRVGGSTTITAKGSLALDGTPMKGKYVVSNENGILNSEESTEIYSYTIPNVTESGTYTLEAYFNDSIVSTKNVTVQARYPIYTGIFTELQNNLNVSALEDRGIAKETITYNPLTGDNKNVYIYYCIPTSYKEPVNAYLDKELQSDLPLTKSTGQLLINDNEIEYDIYVSNLITINKPLTVYYR